MLVGDGINEGKVNEIYREVECHDHWEFKTVSRVTSFSVHVAVIKYHMLVCNEQADSNNDKGKHCSRYDWPPVEAWVICGCLLAGFSHHEK